MRRLVTGEFNSPDAANAAVRQLLEAGVPHEEIHLEREPSPSRALTTAELERRNAGTLTGAIVGTVCGATGGLMMNMVHMLNQSVAPDAGIAPWLFASQPAAILFGALVGALFAGAIGATIDCTLTRLGAGPALPNEECLVTVLAEEPDVSRVRLVFQRRHARHILTG